MKKDAAALAAAIGYMGALIVIATLVMVIIRYAAMGCGW